jgi:hypothetical protein
MWLHCRVRMNRAFSWVGAKIANGSGYAAEPATSADPPPYGTAGDSPVSVYGGSGLPTSTNPLRGQGDDEVALAPGISSGATWGSGGDDAAAAAAQPAPHFT